MNKRFKDVVKISLFGRNDKLITDTNSIYSGYDRTIQTLVGGGINGASISSYGAIMFNAAPSIFFTDTSNKFNTALTSTLTTNYARVKSVAVNTTPTNFTSAPTLLFYGGTPTTTATATAVLTANSVTSITMTNFGDGYKLTPSIAWRGGGIMNITASMNGINTIITGFTITTSPTYTTAPTILLSDGVNNITTTCTLTANAISSIDLPTFYNFVAPVTVYIVCGTGVGASLFTLTPTINQVLNTVSLPTTPYGQFLTTPTISFNGGGVIDITATLTGTAITGFTINNGGYTNCFSSAPTIILSDGNNYATTTCNLTNGAITAVQLPAVGVNNFTLTPIVSVSHATLGTFSFNFNPYKYNNGGYSTNKNIKLLRFELSNELQQIRLAENAHLYLELVRIPAFGVNGSCYRALRLVGSQNINTFDGTNGTTGNPILFVTEYFNGASTFFINEKSFARLPVPQNFLSKGYIEFELETIMTAAGGAFTQAQLNEIIIKLNIEEPQNEYTQDANLEMTNNINHIKNHHFNY